MSPARVGFPSSRSTTLLKKANMAEKLEMEKWDVTKYGPLTLDMMKKLTAEGYQCTDYVFPPGTTFPDHTHAISKKDAIVSGSFKFGMYGKEVVLEPGDMVVVPEGTVHNAAVVGSESVLFVDATR